MGKHYHFIGICGRAMGSVAIALKRQGHTVTGSDNYANPPMRGIVEDAGITVAKPCAPENLPDHVDTVVCGKTVALDEPEFVAAREHGLRLISFPALLQEEFLSKSRNLVVAGTKGKTTTTTMLTWILEKCGLAPDYLIGGLCPELPGSARFTGSPWAVVEGDEYPSANIDMAPKFSHYPPHAAALTNIYPEHDDVYPTPEDLVRVFAEFLGTIPEDGVLYTWRHDNDDLTPRALAVAAERGKTPGTVLRLGWIGQEGLDLPVRVVEQTPQGSRFRMLGAEIHVPLPGLMNVRNAAQAVALARHAGIEPQDAGAALADFPGVVRRQQIAGAPGGLTIVDDEANHPRALEAMVQSLLQRFPERRLHVIYQPQFPGARDGYFQEHLPHVFAGITTLILAPVFTSPSVAPPGDPFDPVLFEESLTRQGIAVRHANSLALILETLQEIARPGDVAVTCVHVTSCTLAQRIVDGLTEAQAQTEAESAG